MIPAGETPPTDADESAQPPVAGTENTSGDEFQDAQEEVRDIRETVRMINFDETDGTDATELLGKLHQITVPFD